MRAMTNPPASATNWPAARPTGISPIQHAAWEEARNAILDLAAEGPVTAVIVGPPGTGKSWLLRELATALGDFGFPTMMLMQGDLPMTVSSGAALLVDNASLMSRAARAEMAAQDHGVVLLAASEWRDDEEASPSPVIIPLRPLRLQESVSFSAEWLQKSGLSASAMDPDILFRLAEDSDGIVGSLVQSLAETITARRPATTQPAIPVIETPPAPGKTIADLIAEAAVSTTIEPSPLTARRRRNLYRPLLAGSAIAALIALGWLSLPVTPTRVAQSPAPAPIQPPSQPPETTTANAAPPPLPPLRNAETPAPTVAAAATPAQPRPTPPPLAAPPPPDLAADIPAESRPPSPVPAAIASMPQVLVPADPVPVAALDDTPATPAPASHSRSLFEHAGGPGLVLIAQPGDTLESLYGSVYRDRNAPPFAAVIAANPGRFKPGAIVVFPEPPGGWQRVQR